MDDRESVLKAVPMNGRMLRRATDEFKRCTARLCPAAVAQDGEARRSSSPRTSSKGDPLGRAGRHHPEEGSRPGTPRTGRRAIARSCSPPPAHDGTSTCTRFRWTTEEAIRRSKKPSGVKVPRRLTSTRVRLTGPTCRGCCIFNDENALFRRQIVISPVMTTGGLEGCHVLVWMNVRTS